MKRFLFILLFVHYSIAPSYSAEDKDSSRSTNKRVILLAAGINCLYVGSMIGLNEVWYKNSPHTEFHFFNDNNEWQQMDKLGHFTTAFHESAFGVKVLQWAGLPSKKAMWIGSLAGFIYQTPIEYFDGKSPDYGASLGDIVANTSGSALVLGQYLLWNEIRIQPKFSFHQTHYASLRPNTLGSNLTEQILKDYNGQTYWLSCNISSFIKKEGAAFPQWLNIAFGYGAHEMVRATKELNGLAGYHSYRQYYLSFDVDLNHVKTKKKWIRYILYPLNFVHIPFPAIEFSKKGVHFHPIYF